MKKFMSMVTVMLAIVTSSATAQQVMPAASKPQKFEGRDGVRALLAAVRDGDVGPGGATLEAKPIDRLQGGLDALEDVGASSPSGAAAAISMSVAALKRGIDGDLQEAAASTIATTYESWVVTASGCEEITVPEWTEVVMTRTAAGREAAAAEAIEMQIDAEQRIDRLRNPGWGSALAWWWSR